jgi:hypothetical protein
MAGLRRYPANSLANEISDSSSGDASSWMALPSTRTVMSAGTGARALQRRGRITSLRVIEVAEIKRPAQGADGVVIGLLVPPLGVRDLNQQRVFDTEKGQVTERIASRSVSCQRFRRSPRVGSPHRKKALAADRYGKRGACGGPAEGERLRMSICDNPSRSIGG